MADTTPDPEVQETATESAADKTQLGDAGKKALDEERNARREAEKRLKELEPLVKKAAEFEEAQKTETEKLSDKLAAALTEAQTASLKALRLEVAMDKAPDGMSIPQVRKLASRIQGASRDEMETDAEELFSEFSFEDSTPGRTPKPRLKSGNDPDKDASLNDPIQDALESMLGIST